MAINKATMETFIIELELHLSVAHTLHEPATSLSPIAPLIASQDETAVGTAIQPFLGIFLLSSEN